MSVGGSLGGGKGEGKTTEESSSANKLAILAEQFAAETTGVRTGLIEAMQEVLSTGGSSIPIVSSAVEGSRRASSRALSEVDKELATSGLAGTPYGENIRAGQISEGEQTAAKTKDAMAQNIFGMISNFVLGQSQTAVGGLSGAISGDTTTRESAKGAQTAVSGSYGIGGNKG